MIKIEDEKLFLIVGGGTNLSSSFINALSRLITTVMDIGRHIGSSIYRYKNNTYCR